MEVFWALWLWWKYFEYCDDDESILPPFPSTRLTSLVTQTGQQSRASSNHHRLLKDDHHDHDDDDHHHHLDLNCHHPTVKVIAMCNAYMAMCWSPLLHVELVQHVENGNTRTQLKVPKSVIIVFETISFPLSSLPAYDTNWKRSQNVEPPHTGIR